MAALQSFSPTDRIKWDGVCDWRELVRGAPRRSVTLRELLGPRIDDWEAYMAKHHGAFDQLRAGERVLPPGDFVILQSELPKWARPFVWFTEDPSDCIPVRQSTRNTVFPGERQMDRESFRWVAEQLHWREVDGDVVDRVGECGCEILSEAPLSTTASWHHPDGADGFEVTDAIVRDERAEQWTRVSGLVLLFVRCTFSPRDVVLQERSRLLKDGSLELYLKQRVTHDLSSVPRQLGGRRKGMSQNSGVLVEGKALKGMPSVQSYARAQAVCDVVAECEIERVGVHEIDKEKAYCFLVLQQVDHFALCYL